jgi:CRISPR/Cas system-associated exonuclease Cas4 (RecB family)
MAKDKYSAVWVSHSSIGDFLSCPRAYYLNNVYKDPKSGKKIQITSPPLALGQAVHEVLETLSVLPVEKRMRDSLVEKLEVSWEKVRGMRGGFPNVQVEAQYKERGKLMLRRVMDHPGPLQKLAVKIKMDLPNYYLSEEDNIILCGKIDWLEYIKDTDSVHIIDFKTGKRDEHPDSLQLPIYHLLVANCQGRDATKASYWYIERQDEPTEVELPDLDDAHEKVLKIARDIKLARQLNRFKCTQENGCRHCLPLEKILQGRATFVGNDTFGQDMYVVDGVEYTEGQESILH